MTLWQTLTASQPTQRGRSGMPVNGRPEDLFASEHKPGRWPR